MKRENLSKCRNLVEVIEKLERQIELLKTKPLRIIVFDDTNTSYQGYSTTNAINKLKGFELMYINNIFTFIS